MCLPRQCHYSPWNDLEPVICSPFIQRPAGAWWELLRRLPPTGFQDHCHPLCVACLFDFSPTSFTSVKNFHMLGIYINQGCHIDFPSWKQPLVDWQTSVLAFSGLWDEWASVWMWKRKGVFLRNVSFLVFYLSPLTRDSLQERKQESSGVVAAAPKINQRPPLSPKEHSLQTCSPPEPLPGLPQCLPAPAHLLLVIGVQGHLFCDLWWQWSSSLVGPQEVVWSFDEAFAFTFSAKAWWPVARSLPMNYWSHIKNLKKKK